MGHGPLSLRDLDLNHQQPTTTIRPTSCFYNQKQELKEALDALGFGTSSSSSSKDGQEDNKAGAGGVEGFASATFPELALLCRCVGLFYMGCLVG